MNTIKPFKSKFCDKECTIYAINSDNINNGLTTVFRCPHCKKSHLYNVQFPKKVFQSDRYVISVYDIICASCNEQFEILNIHDELEG